MWKFGQDRASKGSVEDLRERVRALTDRVAAQDAEIASLSRSLDDLDERLTKLRRRATTEAREAEEQPELDLAPPSPRDPAAYRRWKRERRNGGPVQAEG